MKVVQLGPYSAPHGGVQANLTAIRRLLLERGIPCATVNLTRYRKRDGDGIYYPKSAPQLLWLLLRLRCDIIHLHLGGMLKPRELALSLACCLIPSCKTVLTYHSGGYPFTKQGKSANPRTLSGAIFRRFDAIIAVNDTIARLFQDLGVRSERIHVIAPHAIFVPPQDITLPERLQRFFEAHRPALVTVGLLEPEYDLGVQLDVLPRVRERFPNAGLVIIGAGSLHDDLAARIRQHPCADGILLCGDVPHAATVRAIAEADAFLRTTLYDGDSISVREALYYGTPVVATDNGMRPQGVHLIPVSDIERLHAAIENVLERPKVRMTPRESEDRNIDSVLHLYRSLVSPQQNGEVVRADVTPNT